MQASDPVRAIGEIRVQVLTQLMKKILIVEDVAVNVDLLTQLLEEDYQLVVAGDGAKGVALAEQERPDLILMDMSLPVMDGWEATRRLKSTESVKHIPVIGISAHAMSGDAERAREAGCDDYMTKPVDEAVLFEKLTRFLDA
jgi:CheY-like chemotaxis protein